jgi:mannose-6-phosphate isomerase
LTQTSLYPLLLQPSLHTKIWGGRKLETVLGKKLPTGDPYGESWELHDSATVANGALAGRTVGDLVSEYGKALIGPGHNPADGMPLLAKFLDARDWLSVQVHPNDQQARALNDGIRGKSEAWYVLEADPGARLVIGVKPGTTPEDIRWALDETRLEDLLVYAPVRAGDVIPIFPGTIHALGPGILIYEIQQSSDITYRFYDWNRPGLDGKPRELHVEKSLMVSNFDRLPEIKHTGESTAESIEILRSPYFRTELHQFMNGRMMTLKTGGGQPGFDALTCIEGRAIVEAQGEQIILNKGQTALVPASVPAFELMGRARVLRSVPVQP